MKSKAPLVMMEQIVMVLIFALAAALCLQTFVLSGNISKRTEELNRASIEAQNAAETLKTVGLDGYFTETATIPVQNSFRTAYDNTWNKVTEPERTEYFLDIYPANDAADMFWKAEIVVTKKDGTELFRIPVAGQTEVTRNE